MLRAILLEVARNLFHVGRVFLLVKVHDGHDGYGVQLISCALCFQHRANRALLDDVVAERGAAELSAVKVVPEQGFESVEVNLFGVLELEINLRAAVERTVAGGRVGGYLVEIL